MDLLKLIKEKYEFYPNTTASEGISSVVSHIEIAEKHYENAKKGDEYLFNDVIYRSNQAFEGALKEAYRTIAGKDPNKVTPHKIEKYFEENSVLKERTLHLFTNYRTEWRNKSTHDYKLYFSEQEALLAIVNISAFINILLDQMAEKQAYELETNELENTAVTESNTATERPLIDRIVELLRAFSENVPSKMKGVAIPNITEAALIGYLTAYIKTLASDIEFSTNYIIGLETGLKYETDIFLQKGQDKLVIEIKNPLRGVTHSIPNGRKQIENYLIASRIPNGILYIPPRFTGEKMAVDVKTIESGGSQYSVTLIYPESRFINQAMDDS